MTNAEWEEECVVVLGTAIGVAIYEHKTWDLVPEGKKEMLRTAGRKLLIHNLEVYFGLGQYSLTGEHWYGKTS
jgi:hypothetical protein